MANSIALIRIKFRKASDVDAANKQSIETLGAFTGAVREAQKKGIL